MTPGPGSLLNLGHTIGHGVEACSGYQISHGKAVAIGMTLVTRGAVAAGLCPPEVLPRLEALLARYHLPTATDYAAADLYEKTLSDKKRAGGTPSPWWSPPPGGRVCSTPSPWASCCPWIERGAGAMTVTLLPGPAQGTLAAIPSKSAAHRLLICAALGDRPVRVVCPQTSQDIEATVRCLAGLGASIRPWDQGYDVTPLDRAQAAGPCDLDCGESGSTLRFLLPVAGALGGPGHLPPGGPPGPAPPGAPDGAAGGRGVRGPSPPPGQRAHHPRPAPAGGNTPCRGMCPPSLSPGCSLPCPLLEGESTLTVTGPRESVGYVNLTLRALAQFGGGSGA